MAVSCQNLDSIKVKQCYLKSHGIRLTGATVLPKQIQTKMLLLNIPRVNFITIKIFRQSSKSESDKVALNVR